MATSFSDGDFGPEPPWAEAEGPMEVDPEAMKHFLLQRAHGAHPQADLQSKYDHLKVR